MARHEWLIDRALNAGYDFKDKDSNARDIIAYMSITMMSLFKYDGLPDTIPRRSLELMLQSNGYAVLPHPKYTNGVPYAFSVGASLGGELDEYYMPTKAIINSPALGLSLDLKINEDCVVIPNDSLYIGLMPMHRRYAAMQVENELSMMAGQYNSRMPLVFEAASSADKSAVEVMMSKVRDGDQAVVATNSFLGGLKGHQIGDSRSGMLSQYIEVEQYIKASWRNELGLNANYNMKREAINSTEAELNDDALLPLPDDMYRSRQDGFKRYEELCGIRVNVSMASAWEIRRAMLESSPREEASTNA